MIALSWTGHASAKKPAVQVLYNFAGSRDGAFPRSALVADQAGNLYGTTTEGGGTADVCPRGCGTVFELSAPATQNGAWTEAILYRFTGGSNGSNPLAGLVFDKAGNLYGTASSGGGGNCDSGGSTVGCGVVFALSPPTGSRKTWRETVLHSFLGTDGSHPQARLTLDESGNLFGTAYSGGSGSGSDCGSSGCGVVFELTAPANQSGVWTYSVLHNFTEDGIDGLLPASDLVLDQAGNLYGTTTAGGEGQNVSGSGGTVFELEAPGWTEAILYWFEGVYINSGPQAGVIFDSSGNLYGTTYEGGENEGESGQGTVFELTPSTSGGWTQNVLFNGMNHASCFAGDLIFDSLGRLYGPAGGCNGGPPVGAIFRLQNQGGGWTVGSLHMPRNTGSGRNGPSGLTFGKWGTLYGTTVGGGSDCRYGCGIVFAVIP